MKLKLILFLICLIVLEVFAQTGTIKGKVIDKTTSKPLVGANIILLSTIFGSTADNNGDYIISDISVGTFTIKTFFLGYSPIVKENITIKAYDTLYINFELESSLFESGLMVVDSVPNIRGSGYSSQYSVDMIPIRELYTKSISEMLKKNIEEMSFIDN
jgi:CarboxypepD_reg-like domain